MRRRYEDRVGTARRSGDADVLSSALARLAELDFRDGRWSRAEAVAAEAVAVAGRARESGAGGAPLGACLATLALVEAGLGRADECRAHAGRARADGRDGPRPAVHAEAACALLALGSADHPTALRHLDRVARLGAAGAARDEATARWGADHVEAAAGAGDHARAGRVLRGLADCASRSGSAELDSRALRAAGIMAGRSQDADLLFQEALVLHGVRPVPFEWARTRLSYGERLRAEGRDDEAADHLAAALTTFEGLGARDWAARCG